MIHRPIPAWLYMSLAIGGIFLFLVCYSFLSWRQTQKNESQGVLPGLSGFVEGFDSITKSRGSEKSPKPSWLYKDFKATYWRLSAGLTCGTILSIVLGIAMGAYRGVEAFFSPVITLMSKVPPTAMLGVYMVLFGTKLELYVAMVGLGVFFTMVQSIFQSVKTDVGADQIDKAYTLGASEFEVITEVIWRQILPRIIDNIRLHIGPAMVFLIAAEMLFASEGFGYTIRQQARLVNMNVVYIYLAILGFTGLFFDWFLLTLRRLLCPWFGNASLGILELLHYWDLERGEHALRKLRELLYPRANESKKL